MLFPVRFFEPSLLRGTGFASRASGLQALERWACEDKRIQEVGLLSPDCDVPIIHFIFSRH